MGRVCEKHQEYSEGPCMWCEPSEPRVDLVRAKLYPTAVAAAIKADAEWRGMSDEDRRLRALAALREQPSGSFVRDLESRLEAHHAMPRPPSLLPDSSTVPVYKQKHRKPFPCPRYQLMGSCRHAHWTAHRHAFARIQCYQCGVCGFMTTATPPDLTEVNRPIGD